MVSVQASHAQIISWVHKKSVGEWEKMEQQEGRGRRWGKGRGGEGRGEERRGEERRGEERRGEERRGGEGEGEGAFEILLGPIKAGLNPKQSQTERFWAWSPALGLGRVPWDFEIVRFDCTLSACPIVTR